MKMTLRVNSGLLTCPEGLAQLRELLEATEGRLQVEAPTGLTLLERIDALQETVQDLCIPNPPGLEYMEERTRELAGALQNWVNHQAEGFDFLSLVELLLEWDIPRLQPLELEAYEDLEISITAW